MNNTIKKDKEMRLNLLKKMKEENEKFYYYIKKLEKKN